jgi:hypothetical protein
MFLKYSFCISSKTITVRHVITPHRFQPIRIKKFWLYCLLCFHRQDIIIQHMAGLELMYFLQPLSTKSQGYKLLVTFFFFLHFKSFFIYLILFVIHFLHSTFHSLPFPFHPPPTSYTHHTLSPHGCPHPPAHLTSKLHGASSLLKVRCIISE